MPTPKFNPNLKLSNQKEGNFWPFFVCLFTFKAAFSLLFDDSLLPTDRKLPHTV